MTLAAGFKFENPKAQGLSPILLLSDSRISYLYGKPPEDDGKKIHALAKNIFAVFAGNVLRAQCALKQFRKCLESASSGSFEDLAKILKSSFESEVTIWDIQRPHCLLGAISTEGDSKLFYAKPESKSRSYIVSERPHAAIGLEDLQLELRNKIDEYKPSGLYRLSHFMCLPDDMFPIGYDPKDRAINDARQISSNIARVFLEVVDNPSKGGVNPPIQSVLLLPSGPEQIELYEIASSTQITRKTARPSEVREVHGPSSRSIVELDIGYFT